MLLQDWKNSLLYDAICCLEHQPIDLILAITNLQKTTSRLMTFFLFSHSFLILKDIILWFNQAFLISPLMYQTVHLIYHMLLSDITCCHLLNAFWKIFNLTCNELFRSCSYCSLILHLLIISSLFNEHFKI